jgi:adenylate cyclase
LTAGKNDPVHIKIPKGSYIPTFNTVQTKPSEIKTISSGIEYSSLPTGPSIAVMPLINLTGDKKQDYFVDGLTEELTAELARYQELQVIASQSTMQFKGREAEPKEVGRDLGVRFILSGSVRKNSKTIKFTIRLIDTATAMQFWGENYKRDLTAADLIALQEEIAHGVVGVIADHYGLITRRLSRESRKKAPDGLKTYDAILRFYHYETVLTPQVFEEALSALEQAVERDPNYGLAWAMLGHLYADNHALGFCEIDSSLEKAMKFARKGVSLEPKNQFVLDALTLVYFHRGNKELFLKHLEQTIALNPNSPYIIGVAGWHLTLYGEWDRGIALLEKGMKLNPYHPSWFHLAPFMYHYYHGAYEKAYAEALRFNFPELFWDPVMRAAALIQMGKIPEAKSAVDELRRLIPDFENGGRRLIGLYVKVDDLVDKVVEGLRKAGLGDIK